MISYKSLRTSLIIITILSIGVSLSAWSITDTYFGNKYGSFDTRAFSMGGATAYNDLKPFAIATNPANLTLMKKIAGLQVSADLTRNQSDRSVPLYNSFDNYIDDAVLSSDANTYDDYAGVGFLATKISAFHFGLGAFYQPKFSFDGNYREQIRNNRGTDNDSYPEIIALNSITNEGSVMQTGAVASFGYTLSPSIDLNLGFDYSFLNGDITQEKDIAWSQWAIDTVGAGILPDSTYTDDFTLRGEQAKAGLSLQLGSRLGVGVVYTNKATLSRKGTTHTVQDAWLNHTATDLSNDYSADFVLPSELRVGISYQPRNIVRTWFNLDVERVQWTDVDDMYDDVYNLYVGVEHHIENRIPFRFGFQAVNNWRLENESQTIGGVVVPLTWAKKTLTPMITAGSSIALAEGLSLDLGFGYSWREYESLDMFRDTYYNDKLYTGSTTYALWPNSYIVLKDRGWDNPDKVRENFITLKTGLSFVW